VDHRAEGLGRLDGERRSQQRRASGGVGEFL